MRAAGGSVLACLALAVVSCAPKSDPFLVLSGPKDITRFSLVDDEGESLWVLEAQTPQTLASIHYGVVPTGLAQLEPHTGPPRPLIPGEVLVSETTTLKRMFTHRGVASSATTMVLIDHSMKLRTSDP